MYHVFHKLCTNLLLIDIYYVNFGPFYDNLFILYSSLVYIMLIFLIMQNFKHMLICD